MNWLTWTAGIRSLLRGILQDFIRVQVRSELRKLLLDGTALQKLAGDGFGRDTEFWSAVASSGLHDFRVFGDSKRLHIDATANVNNAILNVVSGTITIDEFAFFGHDVALLTGTHDIEERGRSRQTSCAVSGRDIHIESGVWIASRALVIGPCRIGRDSVVAAGSVVRGDVAPRTVVGGNPLRVIKQLN